MNSVITNNAAIIAVETLNATQAQLQATQKRISTGYRVADATDDGAAFAIAQRVRSDVGSLTSANQELGGAKNLLTTTVSTLQQISDALKTARATLISLSSAQNAGQDRQNLETSFTDKLKEVKDALSSANFNGKSLIGNFATDNAKNGVIFGNFSVVRNETGASYTVGSFDGSAFYNALTLTATIGQSASSVAAVLTASGVFTTQLNSLSKQLTTYGNASNYVDNQVTANSKKIDALNSGIGALVDADLTKESAQLQALQVRQQLATQSLSIANQSPQSLLKLFQ